MLTLPALLKKFEQLHRLQIETERQIADVQRQILAIGKREPKRQRPTKQQLVEVVRETVEALREAGGPLPRKEIAARIGISAHATAYRLKLAIQAGAVERVALGRYQLTSTTRNALA